MQSVDYFNLLFDFNSIEQYLYDTKSKSNWKFAKSFSFLVKKFPATKINNPQILVS